MVGGNRHPPSILVLVLLVTTRLLVKVKAIFNQG